MRSKDDGAEKRGKDGWRGGLDLGIKRVSLPTIKHWILVKNTTLSADYNNAVTITGGCERDVNIKGIC